MSGKAKATDTSISEINESLNKLSINDNKKSSNKAIMSDVPTSKNSEDLSEWKTIGNKIKKYPNKTNISKKIFKAGLDELFKYLSPKIMNKIRYTVENFNPHFNEGTDSFIKKIIVYSYDYDSIFKFKHENKEYKLRIFSDLIKRCNRKNKNGEWLNNSFMDRLIEWAKPSGRDIIFTSCRKFDWEQKKAIKGKYIIMAKWTYHRSEEEEEDDEATSSADESE